MDYLKNRFKERSTAAGLATVAVSVACILFPEFAPLITQIGAALGLGIAAVPTTKRD